jgi:hypothetical protein
MTRFSRENLQLNGIVETADMYLRALKRLKNARLAGILRHSMNC